MQIKRGLSAANVLSLSVGSGTGLSRPRPRLNQQRSADELSKMLDQSKSDSVDLKVYENDQQQPYAAVDYDRTMSSYHTGTSSNDRSRSRSGLVGVGAGGGQYTTSAAMMHTTGHNTDELFGGSSNNDVNSNSTNGTASTKPQSKGRSHYVDKEYQNVAAANDNNSLSPPSSSGSGYGVAQHSPQRSKVSGSINNTPPNSNRKTGLITSISAAAAAALSPPSSSSSSSSVSSSLTNKHLQTMVMSTGDQWDGGAAGGGALHEIEEGPERVVSYYQDNRNGSATADRPPPLPVRSLGETSSRDHISRSSLCSLYGTEFLTVKAAEGPYFSGCKNNSNANNSGDSNKDNNSSDIYGKNGGDGMLQLAEIGYDLGLSLSELENPDGTLRTGVFVDSRPQQEQQQQHAPCATTILLPSSMPARQGLTGGYMGSDESQRGDICSSSPLSFSSTTHPLDPTGQSMLDLRQGDDFGSRGGTGISKGVASVGGGSGNGGTGGEGSSLGIKKHHTVLGAGRAAVTGVFGKFRKSVG